MNPMNIVDEIGDTIPTIVEYDLTGDGRINSVIVDSNHDGLAEVQIQSDPGLVRMGPVAPYMTAYAAGVCAPNFVPGLAAPLNCVPTPGVPAASDIQASGPSAAGTAYPDGIPYEMLPKFPGSLTGVDFDGQTWETLGGSESVVAVDLSGDGRADIFGIDCDGDGVTDIALRWLDTDGDGVFDTLGIDYDQDGNFDAFERMT